MLYQVQVAAAHTPMRKHTDLSGRVKQHALNEIAMTLQRGDGERRGADFDDLRETQEE
jgi:hypothetical protein